MAEKSRKRKPDPLILRDLWSENEQTVLKTLLNLRSGGNIYYIPELLKLLNLSGKEAVEKELVRFIADIKDSAAVPYIVEGLKDPELSGVRGQIISACWQSGLDYSRETGLFIELFLEGDYLTALESFTVIEESLIKLEQQEIEDARSQVLEGLDKVSEEKKPLARELVRLLEPGGPFPP